MFPVRDLYWCHYEGIGWLVLNGESCYITRHARRHVCCEGHERIRDTHLTYYTRMTHYSKSGVGMAALPNILGHVSMREGNGPVMGPLTLGTPKADRGFLQGGGPNAGVSICPIPHGVHHMTTTRLSYAMLHERVMCMGDTEGCCIGTELPCRQAFVPCSAPRCGCRAISVGRYR